MNCMVCEIYKAAFKNYFWGQGHVHQHFFKASMSNHLTVREPAPSACYSRDSRGSGAGGRKLARSADSVWRYGESLGLAQLLLTQGT